MILLAAALLAQSVRLDAPADVAPETQASVAAAATRGAAAAAAWIGRPLPPDAALAVRWFASHEEMGQALGAAALLLDDPAHRAVAFTTGSGRDAPAPLAGDPLVDPLAARAGACAALRELAPECRTDQRVALAELLADPTCAPDCTRLAATLRSLSLLPSLDGLRDPPRPLSPELTRVAWISYFAALPSAARCKGLDATDATAAGAWSTALDAAATPAPTGTPSSPPPSTEVRVLASPLKGFCFAHEGYRWIDGYGSRAAWRSLAHVKELGANAVSLTPFAFQRDVAAPAISALFERGGGHGAYESDASIEVTSADARSLGLTVVLKPHLWCGRGDGGGGMPAHAWCGEIAMKDAADWPAWFAEYERIVVHYALLARRCAIPVLCLGTELQGTTLHAQGAAAWRALAAKARALFPGVVTYCANWGDEVEKFPCWDALDVVGTSAYWPLADTAGAAPATLVRRYADVLARMAALGERTQRPVWFLEIGFADVGEPWLRPNEKAGEPDGGEDQGLAYRVVLQTSRDRGFPDALFWWKWPSDFDLPGRRGPGDRRRDFWPCGRPAERELARAWTGR